ncbi:hypothetical protein AB0J86_34235 [Micromonospora sp. NPDC049559]|uniref:hypothetical protein n=1 Tax=Micromonospora sp. NPDC049559 TaxID=3155923 RepID=UPI003423577D
MRTSPAVPNRHRLVALVALGCVALGSAGGLTAGLTAWQTGEPDGSGHALSPEQVNRLAVMRLTNHRDARAGLRATLGSVDAPIRLAGWVDWGRGLTYLAYRDAGSGARGLLQATPGVLATRATAEPAPPGTPPSGTPPAGVPAAGAPAAGTPPPGTPEAVGFDRPPATPPARDWRIRRLAPGGADPDPLDAFLGLLFALSAERPDPPEPTTGPARWLGQGRVADATVDVLLGPLRPAATAAGTGPTGIPAATPASARAGGTPTRAGARAGGTGGGLVRYWVDPAGRLHRLEAVLHGDMPLRLDLDRTDRRELTAVDALGGRPVRPRAVTDAEAERIAAMGGRNRARRGAEIALAVPTVRPGTTPGTAPEAGTPVANLRAEGWVDWRRGVAYLGVRDLAEPGVGTLLHADRDGVAARGPSGAGLAAGPPPLPPPDDGWAYGPWRQRADALGAPDLDLLLSEVLAAGVPAGETSERLRERAGWLRQDTLDGRAVTVFEVAKPAEAGTPRGQARVRYWLDGSGLLRRLELRTRTGAFAQLDLAPGPVPYLPPVSVS